MRLVLWNLFLVALPFLLYWGYTAFVVRQRVESGGHWNEAPLIWLLAAGVFLAMASLFYTALSHPADPGSVYKPMRLEGGKLIEDQLENPKDASDGSGQKAVP